MIPVGYMYKTVHERPDWLKTEQVSDIYSVSSCVSEDFADWINYWEHNGYWFFNSPKDIEKLAIKNDIDLREMTLFYYTAYEYQWDEFERRWEKYQPESSFDINVKIPKETISHGFDIVTFLNQNDAECSPLSCNHLAQDTAVTEHCLLANFLNARELLESGKFDRCEPRPYRIFEVHTLKCA
ncbi:hypothetical protein [Veronia pacifica]|uniref:Uncharacterized protein n=1 Tax=Veronia pacifica TaxID=1080227 RepID=A0A1C3E542_9GAMM|nr:hypothetical protein [Veronia pacifica]ODA28354.1 hypothetical protein A8L45_23090 [Veronia pacifica]